MPSRTYVSDDEKAQIDVLRNRGDSNQKITTVVGRSHNVVDNCIKKGQSYRSKQRLKAKLRSANGIRIE